MEFGRIHKARKPSDTLEHAKLAESVGFDFFSVGDSQTTGRDAYATLGMIATQTTSIDIGVTVTNPITRHPAVTASAIATVDEIADGRAILGISTGDSAVFTLGKTPAKLDTMRETILFIRDLVRGRERSYEAEQVKIEWIIDESLDTEIPIAMAAEGPKSLELAGEVADIVISGLGIQPKIIESATKRIDNGARKAGRDPDSIKRWLLAPVNVAENREAAIKGVKSTLASLGHHTLQFTFEGKAVPEKHHEQIKEHVRRYDSNSHNKPGNSVNSKLVDELELTDYFADRYGVLGTPSDCVQKIELIQQTDMVDGILLAGTRGVKELEITERLGDHVINQF